jgi:hypothetical protein
VCVLKTLDEDQGKFELIKEEKCGVFVAVSAFRVTNPVLAVWIFRQV